MYPLKTLREQLQPLTENLAKRGFQLTPRLKDILAEQHRLQQEVEGLRHDRNTQNERDHQQPLEAQAHDRLRADKLKLVQIDKHLTWLEEEIKTINLMLPNMVHDTVPAGTTAADNPVLRVHGTPMGKERAHWDILPAMGFTQEAGVKLAQARFNVLPPKLAKQQRYLLARAFDFYEELGYQEHYVPFMVNQQTMTGTGQYPKFDDELFHVDNLMLIPTGEVPLTNLVAGQVFDNDFKCLKLMTQTPCFRKEVGAAGMDTKGLIRQHQFEKLELVQVCHPDLGEQCFVQLVQDIEAFVQTLGVPYRVIELCTGDIGFAGHKAYDIELWFAGQKKYREIATVTWCHEFQARRMKTRLKDKRALHTLNGTGLAAGRVLMAMLEWNQDF